MSGRTPTVREGVLFVGSAQEGPPTQIPIGSAEWFRWLDRAGSLVIEQPTGIVVVRKRPQPGGPLWVATRRADGKVHTATLGPSQALTVDCLQAVDATLSPADPDGDPDRDPDRDEARTAQPVST